MEQEDLEENHFMKLLKTKFSVIYTEAEQNCWIVCVPQKSSLTGFTINLSVIKTHILQPSPYFQGQYITTNKKEIVIEDNAIVTKKGFEKERRVKILFDEVNYNKDNKPFKILCIDRPLEGGGEMPSAVAETLFPQTIDYVVAEKYLLAFPEHEAILRKLTASLYEFNQNYVILQHFLSHTVKKIRDFTQNTLKEIIAVNHKFNSVTKNQRHLRDLTQIVNCYIMGHVHEKIFNCLETFYKPEDTEILATIKGLQYLSQMDLGIRKEFQCSLVEAVNELNNINNKITPLEKLMCLQIASSKISQAVQSNINILAVKDKKAADLTIATDDMIPLLLSVLLQSELTNVCTNIIYMKEFELSDIATTELGFSLVSLEAVVEYLRGDELRSKVKLTKVESKLEANVKSPRGMEKKSFIQSLGIPNSIFSTTSSPSKRPTSNETSISPPVTPGKSNSQSSITPRSSISSTASHNKISAIKGGQSMPDLRSSSPTVLSPKQGIARAPTIIEVNKNQESELGDFLANLKRSDDVITSSKLNLFS